MSKGDLNHSDNNDDNRDTTVCSGEAAELGSSDHRHEEVLVAAMLRPGTEAFEQLQGGGGPSANSETVGPAAAPEESVSSSELPLPDQPKDSPNILPSSVHEQLQTGDDASALLDESQSNRSSASLQNELSNSHHSQAAAAAAAATSTEVPVAFSADIASAAATTDAFLNDLDARVNRKLQQCGGAPIASADENVDRGTAAVAPQPDGDASEQQQQQQQHGTLSMAPIAIAAASNANKASTVADQRQPDEKAEMAASTAVPSLPGAAASAPIERTTQGQPVPGAYATPGRAPFSRTTYYTSSVSSGGRDTNMPPTGTNSVTSSFISDVPFPDGALELTAICVDHDELEHQIREEIIQSAPRADAVNTDDEDRKNSTKASVDRMLRKSRRRYAFCAGILVIIMGVVVGVSVAAGLNNSDKDSDTDTEVAKEESAKGDKDGLLDLLGWLQNVGVLRCGVVGDPSWDLLNPDVADEGRQDNDKQGSGGRIRRRSLQKLDESDQSRGNVNTESGPFKDLPTWEKDKLLDKAATSKEYDIVSLWSFGVLVRSDRLVFVVQ